MDISKINYSVELLRRGEELALALNPAGYWLAFSGGKDSQALLELVKLAGVKYVAYYNVTSNDPPDNVYFIRKYYPEVIFNHPKRNFYKLIEIKGLPTMHRRFCCERLKENTGAGYVVITGVRREESYKRSKYETVDVFSRRKEHEGRKDYSIEGLIESNHDCIKGKDRVMVRPMLNWLESDVWEFLKIRKVPTNPCYNKFNRVGCMFCPFNKVSEIEYYEENYPKFKELFVKSLDVYIRKRNVSNPSYKAPFLDANDYYDWWKSKKKLSVYLAEHRQLEIDFG